MEDYPERSSENIRQILSLLDEHYGKEETSFLEYGKPYQLLFATILSAQCTDARVNLVTKDLYRKYTTLESFARADQKELEQDIYSTGFYHNKAKNIIACAKVLLEKYGGKMPDEMEDLTSLPGVGRKTANLVRSHVYHKPGIIVDTHVGRISRHLGLTEAKDPTKVEFDLMKLIPEEHWIRLNRQLITLGRTICPSRNPKCEHCFLNKNCHDGKRKTGKA